MPSPDVGRPLGVDGSSIVGLKLVWTCAVCKARATTHQITRVDRPQEVEIPRGWRLAGAWTICAKHAADAAA
jgi:hypothetical protein